jgi:hypothetical protein
MKLLLAAGLALALGGCGAASLASPEGVAHAGLNAAISAPADAAVARSERLNAAWEQAEASASRPGDSGLSCTQLYDEQTRALHDPALVARLDRITRTAKAATDAGMLSQEIGFARVAVGVAIANLPNGQIINLLGMGLQAAFNLGASYAAMSQGAALEADMLANMPAYARAMHLGELAAGKRCPTQA